MSRGDTDSEQVATQPASPPLQTGSAGFLGIHIGFVTIEVAAGLSFVAFS
jgi:hypothetical protein